MGNCPSCFNGSCPEVVPVTIEEVTSNIILGTGTVTTDVADVVPPDATKKYVTVDTGAAGFKDLSCRFVDDPADPGKVSASPPDQEDGEFVVTTNSEGVAAFVVEHQGASSTWYLVIDIAGVLIISDAITIIGS